MDWPTLPSWLVTMLVGVCCWGDKKDGRLQQVDDAKTSHMAGEKGQIQGKAKLRCRKVKCLECWHSGFELLSRGKWLSQNEIRAARNLLSCFQTEISRKPDVGVWPVWSGAVCCRIGRQALLLHVLNSNSTVLLMAFASTPEPEPRRGISFLQHVCIYLDLVQLHMTTHDNIRKHRIFEVCPAPT
jgi:hypothetical protein